MRTTLDLPDDLLREAKIAAVRRGSTLRDLVAAALRRELAAGAPGKHRQPALPVVTVPGNAPILEMSPEALKSVLAQDDEAADLVSTG